jgi:1-phosphofructokinase
VILLTMTLESAGNRSDDLHIHPGGQGFWVARMAAVLGAEVVICAPLGGETGTVLRFLLEQESMRVNATPAAVPSGAYIHDRRGGERHELWQSDLVPLGRHELDELYTATLAEGIAAGICVLAGTHEEEIVPADTYRRLAGDLRSNGVRVVADIAGPFLTSLLESGIYLLKVSHEELVQDGYATGAGEREILSAINRLHDEGAENVVVSLAGEGSMALFDGALMRVRAPSMEVLDHRGAGDSMTAALAVSLARGDSPERALRLAAATGALNVTRHGLGSGRAEAIHQIAENVVVEQLESEPA